jgi:hypothetical protein
MSHFNKLIVKYGTRADFVVIYIAEAHPADGWATGGENYGINKARLIEDRLAAAMSLAATADPLCPAVYVDTMSDEANASYGAMFERLYVLLDDRVAFQGGRGPSNYSVHALQTWLESHFGDGNNSLAAAAEEDDDSRPMQYEEHPAGYDDGPCRS